MYRRFRPLSLAEKRNLKAYIEGCVNRICVSDDAEEIIDMLHSSNDYISQLAYGRVVELKERKESEER